MPGKFVVPKADAVENMLGMLFGDTEVADNSANPLPDGYGARLIGDDGSLVALCICDYKFVGFSGAALSMMPVGGAEDMIAEKDFSKTVLDNFYEVMNICTRLLMSDSSDHLKLDTIIEPSAVAEAVAALGGDKKAGFTVKIPRYGSGVMVFMF